MLPLSALCRVSGHASCRLPLRGIVFVLVLACSSIVVVQAEIQSVPDAVAEMGIDEQFQVARDRAFAGEYGEARAIAYSILERSPGYHDVRVLIARTHAWEGERDKARAELEKVLVQTPDYRDALLARIDVERWDDKPHAALEFADRGLEAYPEDTTFLLRKAEVLAGMAQYSQARSVAERVHDIEPDNPGADALINRINTWRPRPNQVAAGISVKNFSRFFERDPVAYLQYGRQLDSGTLIGRVNYRKRFGGAGRQFEVDYYPSLAEGVYAYFNYGYSSDTLLFPQHRLGAEIYANLPRAFEVSAGYRHLAFASSNVNIYTGSLGKYLGNYFISFRPYVTPGGAGTSVSGTLTLRRYFGDAEQYLELRGSYGSSVQERQFQTEQAQGVTIDSRSIGVAGQWEFLPFTYVFASFDYGEEELLFAPGEFVDTYSFSFSLRHRF